MHEIFIEIRQRHAFIFDKIIDGMGGMPYGSQGKVLAFIESNEDLKAAWLMVRRGCHVDFALARDFEKEIKEMMKWRHHAVFRCNDVKEAEEVAISNGSKAVVIGRKTFIKLSIPVFYPLLGIEHIRKEVWQ